VTATAVSRESRATTGGGSEITRGDGRQVLRLGRIAGDDDAQRRGIGFHGEESLWRFERDGTVGIAGKGKLSRKIDCLDRFAQSDARD
jgi:hypothetical protein